MIFITGDTHCPIDISKINSKNFDDSNLTKEDYLIICGDAGLVWQDADKEDEWWQKWLEKKNFTTLFIDGNHENHGKLDEMKVEMWNGGKVHKLKDSVIHLMRGQVFEINGLSFFTMGGAKSHDRRHRKEGKTWWRREMPSHEEYEEALSNLDNHNWSVDYVITHTAPDNIKYRINPRFDYDKLSNFLFALDKDLQFKQWYIGHYHRDTTIDDKHTLIYNEIKSIKNV